MRKAQDNAGVDRSKWLWLSVGAGLLVVGIVISVIFILARASTAGNDMNAPDSPEELADRLDSTRLQAMEGKERERYLRSVGASTAKMSREERRTMFDDANLRDRMDDMSSEDRRSLRRGMWQARRENDREGGDEDGGRGGGRRGRMGERIDEFFDSSRAEQEEVLDGMINRFRNRASRRDENNRRRGRRRQLSSDERDERFRRMLTHTEPETRAKFQEFVRRLRVRAEEQGVELPRRGGRR